MNVALPLLTIVLIVLPSCTSVVPATRHLFWWSCPDGYTLQTPAKVTDLPACLKDSAFVKVE